MKPIKPALLATAAISSLLSLFPVISHAAPDVARVAGDLRVDGIVLNQDNSTVIRKLTDLSSPWSIANTDIRYLTPNGRVGIGVPVPAVSLDVLGDAQLTGNLLLPTTLNSPTKGIIKSGTSTLLHTFGTSGNIFVGINAGNLTNSATSNTALGDSALFNLLSGSSNTAIGINALYTNSSGSSNTANGAWSLNSNTGNGNTANGSGSLIYNDSGNYNTAVGAFAGFTAIPANANITGSNNTFIGYNSGPGSPTQLTNATAIGADALVNQNDSLVLGKPGVRVGIGTSSPDSAFMVTTASSSPVRIGDTGCISPTAGFAGIGLFGVMSGCFNYAILGETGAMPNLYLNRPTGGDINFRMNNGNQMILDQYGGLRLDANNVNDGALHHTATSGAGLTFGSNSGEGIASKRTAGGNQWGLDFYTFSTPRLSITKDGNVSVGLGNSLPAAKLDVSGTAVGIRGETSSAGESAGLFINSGGGKALSATVSGVEVALVDSTGIHAGPGMTGTPIAYGSFDATGAMLKGSNLNCTLSGTIYNCAISGENYASTNFVSIATVSNGTAHFCSTDWDKNTKLQVRIHSLPNGATVAAPFHLVVYKP